MVIAGALMHATLNLSITITSVIHERPFQTGTRHSPAMDGATRNLSSKSSMNPGTTPETTAPAGTEAAIREPEEAARRPTEEEEEEETLLTPEAVEGEEAEVVVEVLVLRSSRASSKRPPPTEAPQRAPLPSTATRGAAGGVVEVASVVAGH